jgi:hypothetical protein
MVECDVCRGYGIFPAELAVGVICVRCNGAGGHEHTFTQFSGLKKYPGIKRVRRSGGRDPMSTAKDSATVGISYGDFIKGKKP